MCKVLLIAPSFSGQSFWNFQATCEVYGARFPAAPLGLITVAALLPSSWQCRLVNRNTEDLLESDLDWADLVMTGGMLPQQPDTLRVIGLTHARRKPVVVGGPDVTSSPEAYEAADFRVLGEAEGVIDAFIRAWNSGVRQGVFEAERFTIDVTNTPIPRFDLLERGQYAYYGVQFARGCPFNCEFCDIIELYGRVPRVKAVEQMLAELETLYGIGYRGHLDFVDDNFIGNKKAVKAFLPHLIAWQKKRGYPFEFSTEASINIADDDALLALMREANFFTIFVGIESPDTDTLVSMQKKQNTRRMLADCVHKVYQAGMFVNAGFIVGFDSEKGAVAEAMIECIEATSIPFCTIGLLYALPTTQLTRRLAREGRLFPLDYTMRRDAEEGVGEQPLQSRPIHRRAGEPAVIITRGKANPAFVALTGDEGLAGFALRLQRIELLLEPLLGGFAGVDRTSDGPVPPRPAGSSVRHAVASARTELRARLVTPKNRGPDQCAPVIRSAITVSDR